MRQAEEAQRVAVDDAFDGFHGNRRQAALGKNRIDATHSGEGPVPGSKWAIGAERDFMLRAVLHEQAHRVIELPRPVIERREIGEDVRATPDNRDGLALPGMAKVGQHHAQLGKLGGQGVELHGPGAPMICEA